MISLYFETHNHMLPMESQEGRQTAEALTVSCHRPSHPQVCVCVHFITYFQVRFILSSAPGSATRWTGRVPSQSSQFPEQEWEAG